MKFIHKAGILAVILAIPAFVLFFLYGFGKNHFDLPIFYATDSVEVNGRYVITKAHTIPDFTFIDQDNQLFDSKSLEGNIYVADFFFTSCAGICPKMTSQLTRVQEAFLDQKDFKIVSFTVDPKRDSAETLKRYAEDYNATPGKWVFLTGEKDSLYTVAQKGFFISAMEDEKLADFIHSEKLILIDKSGRIRGYYNGTEKESVDRLIREIQVLNYGYEHHSDKE